MKNGDPEGRIFLTYPQTNNVFFLALHCFYFFIYFFKNKLLKVPKYDKMQFRHDDVTWSPR